ncbi:hypothetical protein C1H46_008010 [Malus baccata]|uniref:Uncharacterized protein n=1 Tax=Malus baccata TaxID=106549 RepID=A0A540N5Q5_MALBA|nr:hypothetical protein C1H46_008010 [Malus baccata]
MVDLSEVCGPHLPFWSPTKSGGSVEPMTDLLRHLYFDFPYVIPGRFMVPQMLLSMLRKGRSP